MKIRQKIKDYKYKRIKEFVCIKLNSALKCREEIEDSAGHNKTAKMIYDDYTAQIFAYRNVLEFIEDLEKES